MLQAYLAFGAPRTHFEPDPVVDGSMFSVFAMDMLGPHDERVERTMAAIEERLWVNTSVGALA